MPGCTSDGEIPEEALQEGTDAVKAYLLNCMKHVDADPKPSAASGQCQEGVSLNTLVTAMIAEGLGRRAEDLPLSIKNLNLVERDYFAVTESKINLPDWMD